MKKVFFTLLAALILLAAFSGCSKKGAEKLIGKWKLETGDPKVEIVYEFTATNMNIDIIKLPEMPPRKIEMTYTLKSDDGTTVIIAVVHPVEKQTGEFKLTITDNKMKMVDPDGQTIDFTKI